MLHESSNCDVTPVVPLDSNTPPQDLLSEDAAELILKIINADLKGTLAANIKTALSALLEIC